MTYTTTQGKTLNPNEKHHSDDGELSPIKVESNIRQGAAQSIDYPSTIGYTVDDQGILNNYAIEPNIYPLGYPAPRQQRRYVFLAAGAILLVVTLMLIALAVS